MPKGGSKGGVEVGSGKARGGVVVGAIKGQKVEDLKLKVDG